MVKIIILAILLTFFVLGVIHAYIILGKSDHSDDILARLFTSMLWPLAWVLYTVVYVYKKIRRRIKKWKTKE